MPTKFSFDRAKFKALVQGIEQANGGGLLPDDLAKALWLAEACSFLLHGEPITGATYRRSETGLSVSGLEAVQTEPSREDADALTDRERPMIEWSLSYLHDRQVESVWIKAAVGEEVPYHAILALIMRQPEGEELEWAKQRAGELAPS